MTTPLPSMVAKSASARTKSGRVIIVTLRSLEIFVHCSLDFCRIQEVGIQTTEGIRMKEEQRKVRRPYPQIVTLENNTTLALRLMTPADSHRIVTFARSLPEDDLLFLRTDITKAFVVMLWGQNI